jgi:hypothetical protein
VRTEITSVQSGRGVRVATLVNASESLRVAMVATRESTPDAAMGQFSGIRCRPFPLSPRARRILQSRAREEAEPPPFSLEEPVD